VLLYSYIVKKNTSTQREMINYLSQQTGIKISQSTISRTLKREKITYKKATARYSEKKSRMEEIRNFVKFVEFPLFPCNRILAVDECSFHLNETPRYAYSRKGLRAIT
jgi:Winged helix-turn helix